MVSDVLMKQLLDWAREVARTSGAVLRLHPSGTAANLTLAFAGLFHGSICEAGAAQVGACSVQLVVTASLALRASKLTLDFTWWLSLYGSVGVCT